MASRSIEGYPLTFTLCFLTRGNQVLILYHLKPPVQNLWNGVGGRIKADETPYQSCLREVVEETGYQMDALHFAGVLTWDGCEIADGGLYIFRGEAPQSAPVANDEGWLAWQPLEWILTSGKAVDNIPLFIQSALYGNTPMHYHFSYHNGQLIGHEFSPLPPDFTWR